MHSLSENLTNYQEQPRNLDSCFIPILVNRKISIAKFMHFQPIPPNMLNAIVVVSVSLQNRKLKGITNFQEVTGHFVPTSFRTQVISYHFSPVVSTFWSFRNQLQIYN